MVCPVFSLCSSSSEWSEALSFPWGLITQKIWLQNTRTRTLPSPRALGKSSSYILVLGARKSQKSKSTEGQLESSA